jgi:transcriptional regulator with XRE-family HTH domain
MEIVDRDIERMLTLLRNKIRERNLTQLQVQDVLGWGRSYISQLLTKQKSLRVEQVLSILQVIGVPPSEFFGELFYHPSYSPAAVSGAPMAAGALAPGAGEGGAGDLGASYRELSSLLRGLLRVLIERKVIEPEDLEAAVRAGESGGGEPPAGAVN